MHHLPEAVLLTIITISGITDLTRGKIFNAITYPAIALGFGLSLSGFGTTPGAALGGFLFGFGFFFVFFALGWMGGGDVKLMAAVGALKGYPFVLYAMFYSIFLAALIAVLILIWRPEARQSVRGIGRYLRQLLIPGLIPEPLEERSEKIPFGVTLCIGTFIAMVLEALASGSLA